MRIEMAPVAIATIFPLVIRKFGLSRIISILAEAGGKFSTSKEVSAMTKRMILGTVAHLRDRAILLKKRFRH